MASIVAGQRNLYLPACLRLHWRWEDGEAMLARVKRAVAVAVAGGAMALSEMRCENF